MTNGIAVSVSNT